jgi:putative ABC transport system ATP-binding protein
MRSSDVNTIIQTKKLERRYGKGELEVVALKALDIEIKSGEFVAVVGPSGAGKSTLLYQMSLLDEPTQGEVYINSIHATGLSESARTSFRLNTFGYVFQDYALLPELSTLDNVMLPMLMQGMSKAEAGKKAMKSLERIGLHEKAQSLPSQLSGGQQQRVSIARAIAHDPHILFADEPTANLDSHNGRLVMDAFEELHKAGQTIVMVTHEPEYAKRAARIITLKDGTLVSDEKIK